MKLLPDLKNVPIVTAASTRTRLFVPILVSRHDCSSGRGGAVSSLHSHLRTIEKPHRWFCRKCKRNGSGDQKGIGRVNASNHRSSVGTFASSQTDLRTLESNLLKRNFNFKGLLIPKYILGATLPYVLLSLLMLSAVLFAQQVSRLAEVLLYTDLPFNVVAGIAVTMLPGVLSFTIPLATLGGILIGFSRMGTDSEIVAMRSAGVGTWTMLWPVLLLGLVCTAATFYIQLKEVPEAARDLEKVALQGALAKLDSPVEPRTFSTLPRYVIYVRDGDKNLGTWGRVFINVQQPDRSTQIFTARSGRIDSSGEQSELVLSDVLGTKFPAPGTEQNSRM